MERALYNIITKRFFRTFKNDDIKEYETSREMIAGVDTYVHVYNTMG